MVTYAIILIDTIKKEKEIYETEELTYYYYKDNEQESFEKWKNNNHLYAVMEIVIVLNQ